VTFQSFKDKKVLVIGEQSFDTALVAVKHGASLVEVIPPRPDLTGDVGRLLACKAREESTTTLQLRNVAGTTLEDEGSWDDVVISGVGQAEFPEVMRRAQRASKGQVRVSKNAVDWKAPSKPEDVAVLRPRPIVQLNDDRAERKVMLHVHNVRRCGGTGNFVYDLARCFPEFDHVALCVNDAAGDPLWIRDVQGSMRTMYSPQLTKALLAEINPRVVALHATSGTKLEGEWPYNWLQDGGKRFVIRWHHIATRPILPADLSVFVSEHVKWTFYKSFLGKQIKRHIVMPPCTDLKPYARVPARTEFPKIATTGGKACAEMQALMKAQLSDWSWDSKPPGRVNQFAGYLGRFPFAVVWSGHQETWCRTVSEALAAGCVVIGHRAGAIPEQIKHGENGYLFDDAAELVKLLHELQNDVSPERLKQVAAAGREWALKWVDFPFMKSALYPYLTEALMEA
jgi:hypothetical protein